MVDYKPLGKQFADQFQLPWNVIDRQIEEESGWQHYDAHGQVKTSSAGALGIAQLMPATAANLGVNPRDPVQNLRGGLSYDAQLLQRYHGDIVRMLAAYNAGPQRVDSWTGLPSQLPGETQKYLSDILGDRWWTLVGVGPDIPTAPPMPGLPGLPSPGDAGGLMGQIQQWFTQAGAGIQAAMKQSLINKYAAPFMGFAGLALIAIGLIGLVMRSPVTGAALDIAAVVPPARPVATAAGKVTASARQSAAATNARRRAAIGSARAARRIVK